MLLIVRTVDDGKSEILSGHSRVVLTREAGLEIIPAVVSEGLTDEEAMFIVTETNLIQRSFADMKQSERALAITNHYAVLKKKTAYRSDLIEEIEQLTSSSLAKRS